MCFATVLHPTASDVKELIAYAPIPVVVEMGADWCPPCQLLRPFLRKLAIDFGADAHVAMIDIDANRELRLEWEVTSLPQVLVFRHGQIVARIDGFESYAALRAALVGVMAGGVMGATDDEPSPEEAAFAAAAKWADAAYKTATRPANDRWRRLWKDLAPTRDRFSAGQQAAVARGEITADEAKRRLSAEDERLMSPLEPQLDAAMAEAKALRLQFAEAIEEAVEIYASARLCQIEAKPRFARSSA